MNMRTVIWIISIALGVVLLLVFVGPGVPYKRVKNSVCSISGSTRREVTWFGRFRHEERTVSALEQWLKRREPSFQPQWRYISTQTYSILSRSCGVSDTPEVYQLRPILDDVVERFSEERIAGLVEVLRHGSRDEQTEVIQGISDDYFGSK
jgi:hypothetical protein